MRILQLSLMALFLITAASCDKDDPVIPNEEELITTLNFTLTADNGDVVSLSFVDLDGDASGEPVVSGGTLLANTSYTGSIELLNEAATPVEDITLEVQEEDEEHQFFFSSSINDISFAYCDQDENGNPLGLCSTISTGGAGSGTLTVILKHEPEKDEVGVAEGDLTNAAGETDLEVSFPIDVQE